MSSGPGVLPVQGGGQAQASHTAAHHPHARLPAHKPAHFHHVTVDGRGTKHYPTPARYEEAVAHDLGRIYHSHTGRAMFKEFVTRTHHHLTVVPYEAQPLNAYASPQDLRHATLKGQPERSGSDGSLVLVGGKKVIGLGGGSDVDVFFTPVIFTKYCNQHKPALKAGAQPDEVLIHEMFHATRMMRGVFDPRPLGFLYDTEEEFFAILLANIYASETGRPLDLRSDHHDFAPLLANTDTRFLPKKDMSDYRYRLVDKLVRQEPQLANDLRHLKHTAFNPVRRYFELQRSSVPVHH